MKKRIPNYSNAGLVSRVRFWLLKKIAGKSVVMLNTDIKFIPFDGINFVHIKNMNGGLFWNVTFPQSEEICLQIKQNPIGHHKEAGNEAHNH